MKIRKYILKVSVIGLAALSFSCNDKLDEREGFNLTSDTDYTNTEDMILPMIGAYAQVYSRGWEDVPLISVRGDDVNAGGLGDQQDYANTDVFSYNKDYWMYNSVWQNFYKDIIDVNNALAQIELYKQYADESDYALADQYIAETKVLRGWLHLQLSRVWGDVFIISSYQTADDVAAGVQSKADIMQYISDLMDEALPYLSDLRPNERTDIPGGVTKYTALAIKAQANLENGNYQAVADACGAIISSGKFSLYSDYYELFKKPGKLCDENLFELQYSDYGLASGTENNYLNAFFGPTSWVPQVSGVSPGWGFYEPSLKYIKFMLDRGEVTRLQTSVLFTDRGITEIESDPAYATLPSWISNTTPDGDVVNDYSRAMFASGKHYLPSNQITEGRTSYGSGKNMVVIRYAEVLLMYAEALKQGASGSAITAEAAVNLVRARAGLGSLTSVTLQDVMDEKFAELAMEWGIRYFDMVRMNNYSELSYDGRTFTAADQFLPYPQAQVDAIPELDYSN